MIRFYLVSIILLISNVFAFGQTPIMGSMPGPITVYSSGDFDGYHYTPIPAEIMQKILQKDGSGPCANINVVYTGFTPQAQNVFQAAVDIWAYSLSSSVTIEVEAKWEPLEDGVLGYAGPREIKRNFPNAPNNDFYPVALANQIAGNDLSPGVVDIRSSFNSNFDWYYGMDGNPPNNKYDLMTVVLHELAHGFGFSSYASYNEDNNTGRFGTIGDNTPYYYDRFLVLGNGSSLIGLWATALGNALTSDNVFCNSPSATAILGGNKPKMYAPNPYSPGSSIAHWDEASFPAGNVNSLMTPMLSPGEAIHNPGPITLALFDDIGWTLCENTIVDEDCLTWQEPSPSTGWNNFNIMFGGAPCDNGTGCPFNEIQDFEVSAAEAYSVDGFINGGQYTFSICNGPGAGSWIPDFTIIAPSGAVDASGSGTGCAISWTASESGTYLIVINQEGNCGMTNPLVNGYPALTCENGTVACGPNYCATGSFLTDGETTLCPGETTTIYLDIPASLPSGGFYGIMFLDEDGTGLYRPNVTSADLPYTFDNDLNGLLSGNEFDEFLGVYGVTGFVYTDSEDPIESTCASSQVPLMITFLDADDPACFVEEPCNTGTLVVIGDSEICPGETTTVNLTNPATIPSGAGYAINFFNPTNSDEVTLYGITLPYTFDNDLNGVLSANDRNLFEGEYELTGVIYTDETDILGSACAISDGVVIVNFLSASDPACFVEEPCDTGTLVITGDSEICPGETTTVSLANPAIIPTGGGYGIKFHNPTNGDVIRLPDVTSPFTFDNDLNGFITINGYDLLEGEYELTGIVYTEETDIPGSTCDSSEVAVIVNFLSASDPACFVEEPCDAETLVIIGDSEICPSETTTVSLANPAVIPTGGGYGIKFHNPTNGDVIWLPGVTLSFTFDNDLNGFITTNGYDLLEGEYELTGIVYTDETDIPGSTCDSSEVAVIVNFLSASDPACFVEEPCDAETLVIIGDSEICPGETTTVSLANPAIIPTGGGYGIKFHNPTNGDVIWLPDVTSPFTFDNDLNGFITINGYDLLEGEYELTGIVYTEETDIPGSTCDSSEVAVIINFLSASDSACIEEEPCDTGTLVITGDSEICSGETTTVSLVNSAVIPMGGGYGIKFHNPTNGDVIWLPDVTLPFTFDNDLNGFITANGYDLLEGEYELIGIVYTDETDIVGTICDSSEVAVIVNFLSDSDLACVSGIAESESSGGFVVYPNPASNYITLKLNDQDIKNVGFRIMDMGGRILFEETYLKLNADNIYHVDVSNIAQGIYFVVLYSEYGVKTNRLVIVK